MEMDGVLVGGKGAGKGEGVVMCKCGFMGVYFLLVFRFRLM